MLALDLNGRKTGREGAACHDMLGADSVRRGVKADEIARAHIDSADREPHRARIDPVEIDKALKRRAQLRRFVVARGAGATDRGKPRRHRTRGKETGRASK